VGDDGVDLAGRADALRKGDAPEAAAVRNAAVGRELR
jgi:hypothetical protein